MAGAFSAPAGRSHKAYRRGTHRVVAPEQTVALVGAFARQMGITRVANITGLDDVGIPVAQAVRPNSRSLSVSQGKGLTVAAAKASALMESVETYLAERIDRPVLIASYGDLVERRPVVDVGALPRLAGSKFQPGLKIAWIDGRNLFDAAAVWVPYEMVHTDWSVPLPQGSGCFPATSNGLASGNTEDEALVHAVAEVIERDAVALWHALDDSGQAARRVDPGTVGDPECQRLLDRFDRAGIDVAIWDLTTDLAVPVFRVHTLDRSDGFRSAQPAGGSGCHPDPTVALSRALTEAAQSRVTYISGARDDAGRTAYLDRRDEATKAGARRYFRQPLSRSFGDLVGHVAESVDADLEWMLTRIQTAGVRQVIALDLSQAAFPVSAVRVIIPGLEGVCTMPTYTPGARASASHD